jgi:hypothetical protein
MTRQYRVSWEIDIWARSELAAARKALKIQRDRQSTATTFYVMQYHEGKDVPEYDNEKKDDGNP